MGVARLKCLANIIYGPCPGSDALPRDRSDL